MIFGNHSSQFEIRSVQSHIDDMYTSGGKKYHIFSRDCAVYEVALPGGKVLWVLCNHFKSKIGTQSTSNAKRKRQADRVKVLLGAFNLDTDYVAVCGDFNDTPSSAPLAGLLGTPKLHDVLDSINGPRWTYKDGKTQFDYLLVSEALHNKMTSVGVERRGIYSKTNFGGSITPFPQVKDAVTQASDQAAVWANFSV
jgi:endonuclease/exonuclease/phosphatase family metal-dependent hydrolase